MLNLHLYLVRLSIIIILIVYRITDYYDMNNILHSNWSVVVLSSSSSSSNGFGIHLFDSDKEHLCVPSINSMECQYESEPTGYRVQIAVFLFFVFAIDINKKSALRNTIPYICFDVLQIAVVEWNLWWKCTNNYFFYKFNPSCDWISNSSKYTTHTMWWALSILSVKHLVIIIVNIRWL